MLENQLFPELLVKDVITINADKMDVLMRKHVRLLDCRSPSMNAFS
jgi:hypothetical protein